MTNARPERNVPANIRRRTKASRTRHTLSSDRPLIYISCNIFDTPPNCTITFRYDFAVAKPHSFHTQQDFYFNLLEPHLERHFGVMM